MTPGADLPEGRRTGRHGKTGDVGHIRAPPYTRRQRSVRGPSAPPVTLTGLLITMGNLGDRIGRKRLLLAGAVAFGAASAVTAYAPTPELLIAARALLGVAGATIMPSTLSIIRNAFTDPKERTVAVGVWSGMGAAGFALGPVVGGLLLDRFWWGSVFLINLPVMALILVTGLFVLPESRNPSAGRIDLASVLLSFAGVIAVIYAVKEVAAYGLATPGVLVSAALGVAGLTLFARRQTRLAEPLIDVRLFRRRAFSASVGANLIAILGSVLTGFYRSGLRLPEGLPGEVAAPVAESLPTALQAAATLPAELGAAVAAMARQAFVDSVDVTSLAAAGLIAVLAVASLYGLRGVPDVIPEERFEAHG
ncbi:MFS family permease [Streptosporangium album]|uniref:MFS family permease n=1 Tax=Streptosporangium album TaxID=47479 RepID=A0A7W7W6G8_9ACTN|nr:MFS transporter [Streptosporangium album]MBB4935746.1 MFS family permease [Streptosporangium album]